MLAQMLVASLGLSIVRAVSTDGAFQHYSTVSVDSTFANALSTSGEHEAAVLADLSLRFGSALAGGPYEVSASLVAAESPHRRVQDSADRTLTVHYVIQCHLDCTNIATQLAAISAPGSAEGEAHAAAIIAAINTAAAGFGFSSTVVTSTASEAAATIRAPAIVSINLPNTPGGAVLGCTDPEAYNFDRYADLDNGSCRYGPSRPPPPPPPPATVRSYDFCFGSNNANTVRHDFETGSSALPAGWAAVDDVPVSEPGNWYVIDNTGTALANDGWAAYEASNVWGNYPGDNQLTGSYLMNDVVYNSFIAEFEVFSADNDGLGFLFGYQSLNSHFTATEINDIWPSPPADGYSGPHQKLRQRDGPCLPNMNADNNVFSLLESEDGDDGVSVNKANYSPYRGSVIMNMALKVECCDGDGKTIVTFLSSRHSSTGTMESVEKLTGKTDSYTAGTLGLFVYAHTATFDNFQVTPLDGTAVSYCEGAGSCDAPTGVCSCSIAGTVETMPDCSRGITAAGDIVRVVGGSGGGGGSSSSNAVVTTLSSSKAGMTTYQLHTVLSAAQSNIYAMAGNQDQNLIMPAAFQVAAPFGTHVGGVSPAFFPVNADSEFDSWLTVGSTDGSAGAAISTIGLGLEGWSLSAGVAANNGAVFWMTPSAGPGGTDPICLAQVTVAEGSALSAAALLQGQSVSGDDWSAVITWGNGSPPPPAPPPPPVAQPGNGHVTPVVTAVASADGWATYILSADLNGDARSIYSIFGRSTGPMSLPPAFQVAAPFGRDIGGVPDAFVGAEPTAAYDSWLTVSVTDGVAGPISSIGIDWNSWTATSGLTADNGAVFFMNPNDAPDGSTTLGQITVQAASVVTFGAQGRTTDYNDWSEDSLSFSLPGPGGTPPPPPAPVVDCEGAWSGCTAACEAGADRTWTETTAASGGGAACPSSASDCAVGDGDCAPLPPPAPPTYAGGDFTATVNTVATDGIDGMTTYRLSVSLAAGSSVYALAGTDVTALSMPAAFQVATPIGTNTGGVPPAFFAVNAQAEFDSWLTIGNTDGTNTAGISTIGIDFAAWNSETPMLLNDQFGGSVFLMDPNTGPTGDVVLAQVTMPSWTSATAGALLQGRTGAADDWQSAAAWTIDGNGSPAPPPPVEPPPPPPVEPPPPPAPVVDCEGAWSGCTAACEAGADRTWTETTAASGGGAACPSSASDCAVGDGDCVAPPPPPPVEPPPPPASGLVAGVEVVSTSGVAGMTTVRLSVTLDAASQTNVYAVAGTDATIALTLPAAYQVLAPFGADIGGVSPAFFPIANNAALGFAEFDSWLTIGVTDGSAPGSISASPGFNIATLWTESEALDQNDAAIFFMDPATMAANSGSDPIVIVQMTISAADASGGQATAALQGRSTLGAEDWVEAVVWTW